MQSNEWIQKVQKKTMFKMDVSVHCTVQWQVTFAVPSAFYIIGIPFSWWAVHRKRLILVFSDSLYRIAILYNFVTLLQSLSISQAFIDLLSVNWPQSYRKTQIVDILMRIPDPFELNTWPISGTLNKPITSLLAVHTINKEVNSWHCLKDGDKGDCLGDTKR